MQQCVKRLQSDNAVKRSQATMDDSMTGIEAGHL